MRPFCLVKSRSQGAAANAGVLSVYLTTILYHHRQLFTDIERENIDICGSSTSLRDTRLETSLDEGITHGNGLRVG